METKTSVTDTLLRAMEKFGEDEPTEALLITLTESGEIAWYSTSNSTTQKLGMLEFLKAVLLHMQLNSQS